MDLIVGLGNTGEKYVKNRHNIGFRVIDAIATHCNCTHFANMLGGQLSKAVTSSGERLLLFKSGSFMNESGSSIFNVLNFYKLNPLRMLVVHDDIDLPLGCIKFKTGGKDGGHRGLRSLNVHVKNNNYERLRIGVSRPNHKDLVSNYVLSDFLPEEEVLVQKIISFIVHDIDDIFSRRWDLVISNFARVVR